MKEIDYIRVINLTVTRNLLALIESIHSCEDESYGITEADKYEVRALICEWRDRIEKKVKVVE